MSHDYREHLVDSLLSLSLALKVLDHSDHADHPDVINLRDQIYHAYDYANEQIKRLYAKPGPGLSIVD